MDTSYFEVAAGKWEYDESEEGGSSKNYKYIDRAETLSQALDLMRSVSDYQFSELHYIDPKGERWEVTLERVDCA